MRNSQIKNFFDSNSQTENYVQVSLLEAEKNFVRYYNPQQAGSNVVEPETIIKRLDSGEFDSDLVNGLSHVASLWNGKHSGCFVLSSEQNMALWRWVVAAVYVGEMFDANGAVEVKNERGMPEDTTFYIGEQGGIIIYPCSERFALANNVESLAYEIFPANKAHEMASAIYRSMIDISPVTGVDVSEEGLKGMALLHDSFIETLKTEGIPAAPVAH
ncbi:hypothetical protein [Klebsiella aerogenes]|uniref:Prophage protein n=1 Tax=Klebsiella aerogenes TaxID=548 RepID=A0AAP9QX02_KLEAE|nr:hypothetical protein [Klebsiella aerogenes]QMR40320.1 hypothetical protein HV331_12870 [Klebsiella aerogenes]